MALSGTILTMSAISFDTSANGTQASGTSLTYSHTNAGNILWVGVALESATDVLTGVTYNSVSMTQATKEIANSEATYLFYLVAPSQGVNNVVISWTGTLVCRSASASYTNAVQTGQPDATGIKTVGAVGSSTLAVTTVANNCWMVSFVQNSAGTEPTAGTGTTRRNSTGAGNAIGDSNGAINPNGSYSMSWSFASGGLNTVQASFAPIPSASGFFMIL